MAIHYTGNNPIQNNSSYKNRNLYRNQRKNASRNFTKNFLNTNQVKEPLKSQEIVLNFFSDKSKIDELLKSQTGTLHERIIKSIQIISKEQGLESRQNPAVIRQGINFGSIDLSILSLENNEVSFSIVFGTKDEMLSSIVKLNELCANSSVLVSSSKSKNFSKDELSKIVNASVPKKNTVFYLFDIEDKSLLKL